MQITYYAGNLVEHVSKYEHFLREILQNLKQQEMVDSVVNTKPLKDHVIPTKEGPHFSIVHPPIAANNF